MTAEVAILNSNGVAMAADSAVSFGNGKIFNSVNKLFALSHTEPVGIMVYSSANVMGVPVETVIKEYRRKATDEQVCFDTLEDYTEDFIRFLLEDDSIFDESARIASVRSYLRSVSRLLWARATGLVDRLRVSSDSPDMVKDAWNEVIRSLEETRDLDEICSSITASKEDVREAFYVLLDQWIADEIAIFPSESSPLNVRSHEELTNLYRRIVLSTKFESDVTGFVITGFGKKDVFPKLRSFEFHFCGPGVAKLKIKEQVNIKPGDGAILPFAQADVMNTFINGLNENYLNIIGDFCSNFFDTQKQLNPHMAETLIEWQEKFNEGLVDEIVGFRMSQHRNPLMETVAGMPKPELATLAEALINLTSLRRRSSTDAETVGGPTDVAVISKGDGFVWIKRKHYFEPEFNPDFVERQRRLFSR